MRASITHYPKNNKYVFRFFSYSNVERLKYVADSLEIITAYWDGVQAGLFHADYIRNDIIYTPTDFEISEDDLDEPNQPTDNTQDS